MLAVAYLQFVLNVPLALYGTLLSIILASVVQFMPFGMRYSYAGILQIHRELEEVSAMSGARAGATFFRIVLPLAAPAVITCWLFIFLMVSKAVSIPLLLAGPNSQVVSVTMFDMWQNGVAPELAALGIIWTAIMTIVSTDIFCAVRGATGCLPNGIHRFQEKYFFSSASTLAWVSRRTVSLMKFSFSPAKSRADRLQTSSAAAPLRSPENIARRAAPFGLPATAYNR